MVKAGSEALFDVLGEEVAAKVRRWSGASGEDTVLRGDYGICIVAGLVLCCLLRAVCVVPSGFG